MAHIRNLPTMTGLAECVQHRNAQMHMQCLLCASGPEAAQHLWECPVQTHEWHPARQCLHLCINTYVGPRASHVQGQLWDPAILEH